MKLMRLVTCTLLLSGFVFNALAANKWQLEKKEQGVEVYTRASELSDFKEFKATVKIAAETSAVFAAITEPSRLTHWMADTIYAEIIERGAGKQSAYIINKVPFPLQNRDGVFQYEVDKSNPEAIKIVVTSGNPNIKANDDYVRIASAKGYWLIEKSQQGSQVTYQMLLDPGGSVPSWIANTQVVSVPFRTLVNLREEVKRQSN